MVLGLFLFLSLHLLLVDWFYHWDPGILTDLNTCAAILDEKTNMKHVLDAASEAVGVDDELEVVDGFLVVFSPIADKTFEDVSDNLISDIC